MHPVERFLAELARDRAAGTEPGGPAPLRDLLDAAGARLTPRVRCIVHPRTRDGSLPTAGLFAADQLPRGEDEPLLLGVPPERGAVEARPPSHDARRTATSEPVARLLGRYGQVLVTSLREWIVVEHGENGKVRVVESFALARTEAGFWRAAADPDAVAALGDPLLEFLQRAMLRPAPLADPADVARVLAAYARDARGRVERAELPALEEVRASLEEALGSPFLGERIFRSFLVQMLFSGLFSGWARWARQGGAGRFDWRTAAWYLRVPVMTALFQQVAAPDRLGPLGVAEMLDRAAEALNRVEREAFFARLDAERAVRHFHEPFLEAFDPELRHDGAAGAHRLATLLPEPERTRQIVTP